MSIKRSFLIVFLCVSAGIAAAPESFYEEVPRAPVHKRKSISALREELGELFEDLAHALIDEIELIAGQKNSPTQALFVDHYHQLLSLEDFLKTGETIDGFASNKHKKNIDAWVLVAVLARIERLLLYSVRELLEKRNDNVFVCAGRKVLSEQIAMTKKFLSMTKIFKESMVNQ